MLGLSVCALCLAAAAALPARAGAVTLQPGDILVADGVANAIVRVDPLTGQQTLVSNNAINTGTDYFNSPGGIALDSSGQILVADTGGAPSGDGSEDVIRVDPATGQQTLISNNAISTNDLFERPIGIIPDATGKILVGDQDSTPCLPCEGAVIRVDPATGQQTAVSNNTINTGTDLFLQPSGIVLNFAGQILVADEDSVGSTGAVISVDPATGQQTAVSNNTINTGTDLFSEPYGIALDALGRILVADSESQGVGGTGAIIRVDPATGQQTAVSNNTINTGTDQFLNPQGIAVEASGQILVGDQPGGVSGSIIRVDPVTGQQTVVSNNAINTDPDLLVTPFALTVVPQPAATPPVVPPATQPTPVSPSAKKKCKKGRRLKKGRCVRKKGRK